MRRKLLGILMTAALTGALLAGCQSQTEGTSEPGADAADNGNGDENTPPPEGTEGTQGANDDANAQGASYSIVTNTFGVGVFPLDDVVARNRHLVEDILGMDFSVANNEFTTDKALEQLQTQLSTNPDGALLFLMSDVSFDPCIKACMDAEIVFGFNTNFPTNEEALNRCLEYENFAGGISSDPYKQGAQMAEYAYKDGCRKAVLTLGALGDYNQDQRCKGFTDKFTELGGAVLQEAHSADPSEAVQKTNDLLTSQPDADCIYGGAGDYVIASANIKESRQLSINVYGTDIDPTSVEQISSGLVTAANGGVNHSGSLAMTLVINCLDGHKIVDENGKAVMLSNMEPIVVTAENAQQFVKLYAEGSNFISDEEYKSLLYRYNPDVDMNTYVEFLEGYADRVYQLK